MDETVPLKIWFEKIELNGQHFATAKEYIDYMTEHRLWGPHPKSPTHEEWEAMKAKAHAETGAELGAVTFVPGKMGSAKIRI